MIELKNKTVLLTGASSGIGFALANLLAMEKVNLILVARRIEKLDELKLSLENYSSNTLTIKCDVTKKDEVQNAFDKIRNTFGFIDIAILNAGVGRRTKVTDYKSELAEETFGVNVLGMIYWIEQLLPDYLKKEKGTIVGVSSLADNRGFTGSGFYSASKAAVSIYLEGLRVELKKHNIKVLTVKPGFVKTPMTDKNEFPMPMMLSAEKAAEIILKGIKKEKRIIQFPFPIVLSSKLIGMLPGSVYEFLADKFFNE